MHALKRALVPLLAGAAMLLFQPISTAHAGDISIDGLSGCGASRTGPYSQNGQSYFSGGHSYCSSGGTSGIQRVRVYCLKKTSPGTQKIVYGNWQVAGYWSEATCPIGYAADQAQVEISN